MQIGLACLSNIEALSTMGNGADPVPKLSLFFLDVHAMQPPISRALERLSYSGRMFRSPRWLGMCVAITGGVERVYLHAVKFGVLGFS